MYKRRSSQIKTFSETIDTYTSSRSLLVSEGFASLTSYIVVKLHCISSDLRSKLWQHWRHINSPVLTWNRIISAYIIILLFITTRIKEQREGDGSRNIYEFIVSSMSFLQKGHWLVRLIWYLTLASIIQSESISKSESWCSLLSLL